MSIRLTTIVLVIAFLLGALAPALANGGENCGTMTGRWDGHVVFYAVDTRSNDDPYYWTGTIAGNIDAHCNLELTASNGCVVRGALTKVKTYSRAIAGTAHAVMCPAADLNRSYTLTLMRVRDGIRISLIDGLAREGWLREHGMRATFHR